MLPVGAMIQGAAALAPLLFRMPGSAAAARAQRAMAEQAQMQSQMMTSLLPQLMQQYQNPNTSPFQGQTQRDYRTGAQQLQQNMAQRGLGQSSLMGNALAGLWNSYGNTLANNRYQTSQDALNRLTSLVNPASTMGANQQVYANAQGQSQGFLGGLGNLARLYTYWQGAQQPMNVNVNGAQPLPVTAGNYNTVRNPVIGGQTMGEIYRNASTGSAFPSSAPAMFANRPGSNYTLDRVGDYYGGYSIPGSNLSSNIFERMASNNAGRSQLW